MYSKLVKGDKKDHTATTFKYSATVMQMTTEKQHCRFVFEILKGPFSLRHNMLQLVQQRVDQSLHRVLPCHATDAYKMLKLM